MEWTAEIVRGWPGEGAIDRTELIKQGSTLVNGDVVEMQPDGTVDKVGATASNAVGLVVRGNGDSFSAANSFGLFSSPQSTRVVPTQTAVVVSGTILKIAVTDAALGTTGHGYAVGDTVTIAGVTPSGYNGTWVITAVTTTTVSVTLATTPSTTISGAGTIVLVTASAAGALNQANIVTNSSGQIIGAGKAVVLWGNYVVRTKNYAAGAYVPGSPVTAASGKFALAAATSQAGASPFAVTFGDPVVGTVLRVQGTTSTTEDAHLVIVVR